ncbi:hypothetical protein BJ322DRAFT_1037062 [Thelephora terrestris]|uniref:Uncharacterized protein n=1 Tax=Thelephora terrestris TaxID=56493 RepID=A0A9P6HM04_9AGAM|nr:hypothetical protein BJ322DRAFT_1037062 [Thelephora terrestris]
MVVVTNKARPLNAIISGVRPKKPEEAARLGFTEELWTPLEECWREDRSARSSVEDILPYLNDAAWRWDMRPATPASEDGGRPISVQAEAQTQHSTQTGSPLSRAGGSGNGNREQNDPTNYFPSQESTSTPSGPPSTCRLNGCNKPAFVNGVANNSNEYCSQKHREDAVAFGQVRPCIMCQKMPRCQNDHFCSSACREEALSA